MRAPNNGRSERVKITMIPIITCMGRLAHLQKTLPGVIREFERAIVVDWSCPQKSGEWARRHFGPAVEVVEVAGQRYFHKARALNAGARRAAMLGAEWLLFLDADTHVVPGLRAACEAVAPGEFAMADRADRRRLPSLTGVLLVALADFDRIGGFDDVYVNYGCEDLDMRCRLAILGKVRPADLPPFLVRAIPHDDWLRVQHYAVPDPQASGRHNWQFLKRRIRQWTGRDIESLPEIQDILYESRPSMAPRPRLVRRDVGSRIGRIRWGAPLKRQ
jgi:hypothetical protein